MLLRHSPTIDELLGDALVQAVMRADKVEPQALRTVLTEAAKRLCANRVERERPSARAYFANPRMRAPNGSARAGPQSVTRRSGSALCC